ncbi:MAG: SDR family NAD(P)-dependent oxidoreductase [Gammaproteobacteria bacterium]|nr:SDR family NAD(P)-dependent oxidoreductase [Gammaproteobacteria bacterium]
MKNADHLKDRIAIVGLDCRLPGADSVEEFWANLIAGQESMIEFSDEQLISSGVSQETFSDPRYVRKRGIVENADLFDAEFFNFTPREAELLDPQHRHFLECAWHALEDSGIDPFDTDRKIAVFGGTGSPYHFVDSIENESVKQYASGTSIVTSNDKDYVTTRVSYKLNLKGPSVNVQSACSTSMVSVVLGIDSLLNHQSDLVLAGGVTIELPEYKGYMYQEGGLESPDGKCRTFDKDASGTAFSRGCGVVALKRLEDAVEDNDHIYAVILGGAINNDGNRKAGFTAPSVDGQVEVLTETIELAGIDPATITMVEAHGTSTPVGDPIEVASLTTAFHQYTKNKGYCAIGSVKTNIGHTDVASGVSSLIKTCLSLKHGIIPASLNFNEPNPAIDFENSPFYVNTTTGPWKRQNGTPARALVNSFGVGGTNACLILEEWVNETPDELSREYDSLFVSAHHKSSFQAQCENLKSFLERHPEVNVNALAHSSRVARKAMKYRRAITFKDREDLISQLASGQSPSTTSTATEKAFVWMFPGQGNQYLNMGLELYKQLSVFRDAVDQCCGFLEPLLGLDVRELIYPADGEHEHARKLLDRTYITQPAIFVVSYATARVFQSFELQPDALIGHSVGEYVAAALSGVMSLEDALTSVALRGKLVYELPQGSMLAVLMTQAELTEILPAALDIAVINSPELVVVSGATADIDMFAATLAERGIFTKLLPTSHAFHSRMMLPCLETYREAFKTVHLRAPSIPIVSTVTGKVLSDEQAMDHEYWVQHVLRPVRFSDAAKYFLSSASTLFLECGPGQSLESAVKRQIAQTDQHVAVGSLYEHENALMALDAAIGKLWVEDVYFDYTIRYNSSACQKISFPLLPFNRRSHRIDFSAKQAAPANLAPMSRQAMDKWFYVPSWKRTAAIGLVPGNRGEEVLLPGKWVVFSDNEFADALIERIRKHDLQCITVRHGDCYQEQEDTIQIRINDKQDHQQLVARLADNECQMNFIYSWVFSSQPGRPLGPHNVDAMLDRNFYGLMYLCQALTGAVSSGRTQLSCLVQDAFDITGKTTVKPEMAVFTGPVRVLFKENPDISTRLISIESSSLGQVNRGALFDQLISESRTETEETIVSYSGSARWTEVFEQVTLRTGEGDIQDLVREKGIYLITGGAGGIGRTLSQFMAEQVHCTLIWTGRRQLPDREDWSLHIADKTTDTNLREQLESILAIEKMGSKVHYFTVDITDLAAMTAVMSEVESCIGPVDGVIHSAGSAGGGVLALQEKVETEKVLSPKVKGTLILQQLFHDRKIDFFHLFSSITAILGEAGRVDYISANAFMDAASHSDFLPNCKTVCSVNWGQWGQIGMAADWHRDHSQKEIIETSVRDSALTAKESTCPVELRQLSSDANTEIYSVGLNAGDHWVLNEHLLYGMNTLVGTTFVHILADWKQQKGFEADLVIEQGVFSMPLIVVNDSPINLQLVCERSASDQYNFTFRSMESGTPEEEWRTHFSGSLCLQRTEDRRTQDIEALIAGFRSPADTEKHFTMIRDDKGKMVLHYSSRWDCKKAIYCGENEWLCKLALPAKLSQDLDVFGFHPAMLDVATSAHFPQMTNIPGIFLPHTYGKVRLIRPFTPVIYSMSKLSTAYSPGDEFVFFDFDIYTEAGELALSIEDYAFVRTGNAASPAAVTGSAANDRHLVVDEADILPSEGKDVFDLLFRHPGIQQLIVYPPDLELDFKESKISYVRKNIEEKKKATELNEDLDDRPDIDTPFEAPENEIEKGISAVWTSILGINKLGLDDSFMELGGNSLLGIQVVSAVSEAFGVEIRASDFVTHSSIRSLAELVLTRIMEEYDSAEIESALDEELLSA